MFKSGVRPIEIGRRLTREMDDQRTVDVRGRTVAPNSFTIAISPDDHEAFVDIADTLARELCDLPASEMARRLIEGREEENGPLARTLNVQSFTLPPMPNLFFTRDSAMSVGGHVLIGSMRFGIRWTEELLMKALFSCHPALKNAGILYDGASERRYNHSLEGGDVHVLRHDTVMADDAAAGQQVAHPLQAQGTGYGIVGEPADQDGQLVHQCPRAFAQQNMPRMGRHELA